MSNKEISNILLKAKANDSYLWDLPRDKWKAIDWYNLKQIEQGKEYINKNKENDYVELSDKSVSMQKAQEHRMKLIRRKSDGMIFKGLKQLCRETGINRTSMSRALNNHPNAFKKYIDEFEFVNN